MSRWIDVLRQKVTDFVASFRKTPSDIFDDMCRTYGHRLTVVRLCYDSNTSDDLLREMVRRRLSYEEASRLMKRVNLPEDLMLECVDFLLTKNLLIWHRLPYTLYPSVEDRLLVAINSYDHNYSDIENFLRRARNPTVFTSLASRPDFRARLLVAESLNTPSEVWMGMYKDRSKRVREAVATRANAMGLVDVFDAIG